MIEWPDPDREAKIAAGKKVIAETCKADPGLRDALKAEAEAMLAYIKRPEVAKRLAEDDAQYREALKEVLALGFTEDDLHDDALETCLTAGVDPWTTKANRFNMLAIAKSIPPLLAKQESLRKRIRSKASAKTGPDDSSHTMTKTEQAIAMLLKNPELSDREIAKRVGLRSSAVLTRSVLFQKWRIAFEAIGQAGHVRDE